MANEGRLEASGRRVDSAECTADCVAVAAFGEAIKGLAATEVVRQGKMQDGDEILGFVNTDANAAIRMKAKGHGRFVIQQTESGAARGGVRFEIDAPPNCNMDEALQCLKMADLTPAEVEVERENIKRQLGVVENPFPTKMGLA